MQFLAQQEFKLEIHKYTIDALKNTKNAAKGKIPVGNRIWISTEKDVQKYVSSGADAVIVGSANIKDHGKHACKEDSE